MKKNSRIIQIVFNIYGCFLTLFFIFAVVVITGNKIKYEHKGNNDTEIYKEIYELVKTDDFVEGKVNKNTLYLNNGKVHTIQLDGKAKNYNRFFDEIRKNEKNEIFMKKYGGILGNDEEIVFSEDMYFNQVKYVSIDLIDEDIFLCKISESYHSEPISMEIN